LFVCHSTADLVLLDDPAAANCAAVVASDAPDVQRAARRHPRVRDSVFIDQMNSVFGIIEQVVSTRDLINNWLTKRVPFLDAYLVELIKHAEGGLTTQRIQDILLLVDSSMRLLTRHRVHKLFVLRRIAHHLEDEILVRCAKQLRVDVVEHRSWSHRLLARFHPVKVSQSFYGRACTVYLPVALVFRLRIYILLWNIVVARAFSAPRAAASQVGRPSEKLILFLLGSSASKHVDDAAIAMAEFASRSDCTPLALSWSEPRRVRAAMDERGLRSEPLESWITLRELARAFRTRSMVRKQVGDSEFTQTCPVSCRDIFISDLLTITIQQTVEVDLFTRVLMARACDVFLAVSRPSAVKVWGELRFDLSRVCYETIVSRFGVRSCVFFYYPVGIDGGIGYGPPPVDAIDFYFIHGEIDRQWHSIAGENSTQVVSGYSKESLLQNFAKIPRAESFQALGLEQSAADGLYVFYASSPVIRGCVSPAEYYGMADAVIGHAAANRRITVLLKPHPNDSPVLFQQIRASHGNPPNVILLDKTASVYHCINAADIVLTKYSTAALEAMKLRRPVISLALDGEPKFQDIFEEAVEKFHDSASCLSLIELLSKDRVYRAAWKECRVAVQDAFLPRKMYQPPVTAEKIIVDTILAALARRDALPLASDRHLPKGVSSEGAGAKLPHV
jgi:hypothetical protein